MKKKDLKKIARKCNIKWKKFKKALKEINWSCDIKKIKEEK